MRRALPGDTLVDVFFPLALLWVALQGWSTTYQGSQWLLVGLGGGLVGALLAAYLRRRGWGADVTFLLLLPVYALTAAPVAGLRFTTTLVQDLFAASYDAWLVLATSHPPLPEAGATLLPPYVLGLLAGGLTVSIALRSNTPASPVVVPVAVFGAVQVLGRHETRWGLGLAFGLLLVIWLVLRGWRLEVRSGAAALVTRAGLAAALLGAATLAATPVARALPVEGAPRIVVREQVPAYDLDDLRTPLSDFRRFTDQPPGTGAVHDERLLTVDGVPPGSRLRFAALDTYDQTVFTAGDQTVPGRVDDRFLRVNGDIEDPASGEEAFVHVQVHDAWASRWLPTAGAVQWLGFEGPKPRQLRRGVRYNPATGTAVTTFRLSVEHEYEFTTVLFDDRVTPEDEPYPDQDPALWEQARFVHVPAHGWAGDAATPMQAVFRVAKVLRTEGRFSDGVVPAEQKYGPGHDRVRLGPTFIHGSLTGNEEQYAAVMALAAVRLGVPARVVVGAVVPRGGVVHGRDTTAWVELRVADGSWRVLPTETFTSQTPPEPDRFQQNLDPRIKLPPGTPLPQLDLDEPVFKPTAPEEESSGVDLVPSVAWWRSLVIVALVLLLLGLAAMPLAKAVRRRHRARDPRFTMRYAGAWLELVDTGVDLGLDVHHRLTRVTQARRLGQGSALAAEADRVIFGSSEVTAEAAADFWARVEAERRLLLRSAPWYRRLFSHLNPASLAPRGGFSTKWRAWRRDVVGAVLSSRPSEAGRLG